MKVYVDELPIGCKEFGCVNCPYAEIQGINHYFINNEIVSYRDCVCKLDKTCGFKCGEKTCPLQPLTDYTKQVRKEVVKEIKKEILKTTSYETEEELHSYLYDLNAGSVLDILDQIQGE